LDLFGTSIQHPEDHFVQYFCGTEPTLIERGSPRRSPRKNSLESDNSVGQGLSSVVSPGRGDADLPGQVGAQEDNDRGQEGQGGEDENVADQRKGRKETDQGDVCPTVEKNKTASPRRSERKNPPETLLFQGREVQGGVVDTAGKQGEGFDDKGQGGVGVVIGRSGNQDRTEDKIQEFSNAKKKTKNKIQSRKVSARQLPLKKHRYSSIYYHSAFTMLPRHKHPENISSNPEVLDLLLKVFSSRARVSTVTIWNPIVELWNQGKKPSFLSLPPLTQESNLGNDGLTLQSKYEVNINNDEYQESLDIDISLLVESMPPDDQLKKHYTKLLQGLTSIKQMTL
jgi:hypothetical protein